MLDSVAKLNAKKVDFGLSITISEQFLEHKAEIVEWLKDFPVNGIFYNLYHFSVLQENWKEIYEDSSEFLINSFNELNEYRDKWLSTQDLIYNLHKILYYLQDEIQAYIPRYSFYTEK